MFAAEADPSALAGWPGVFLAAITVAGAVLERRHSRRMNTLEKKNDDQHAAGLAKANDNYTLIEEIARNARETRRDVGTVKTDVAGLKQWATDHEKMHDRETK